jgi:hypothetical protein
MNECKIINCDNTDLVYSGISALMLGGIPTESYCYSCANAYNQIDIAMSLLRDKVNA